MGLVQNKSCNCQEDHTHTKRQAKKIEATSVHSLSTFLDCIDFRKASQCIRHVRGSVIEGVSVLENTVVDKQNQAATEVTPVVSPAERFLAE